MRLLTARPLLASLAALALVTAACTGGTTSEEDAASTLPVPSVWTVVSVDGVRVAGASLSFTPAESDNLVSLAVDDGCTSDVATLTRFNERWIIERGIVEPACEGPLGGLFTDGAIVSTVVDSRGDLEMVVGGIDILAEHFVSNSASDPIDN